MPSGTARTRPDLATFETGWECARFLPDPALTFPEVVAFRIKTALEAEPGSDTDRAAAFTVVKADVHELKLRKIRYRRAARMISHAADALRRAKVVRGDRVLVCVARPEEFFAFFM